VNGGTRRRRSIRVIGGATVALAVIGVAASVTAGEPLLLQQVVFLGVTIVYLAAGTLIVERRPGNRVGPMIFAVGLCIGVYLVLDAVIRTPGAQSGMASLAALLVSEMDGPVFLLTALLLLLFPDGRLPSPRWRWAVGVGCALAVIVVAGAFVRPGPFTYYQSIENPMGDPTSPLNVVWSPAYMAEVLVVGASALSLVARWRRAGPVERAQLKWVAGAAVLLVIAMVTYGGTGGPGTYSPVGDLLVGIGFSLIPISITIAILRYRLYEIDRIISRTLGWAIVTALLVVVFALGVVGLQAVLAPVTASSTLAVAASTLVAAALFQPLRSRVQRSVDRRFDRSRYDGERVLAGFNDRLRDQVDLDELEAEVRRVAGDAVLPASTGIWLRSATNRPTSAVS